jgi:acetyl esterase
MALNFKLRILLWLQSFQKQIDLSNVSAETFRAFNRKALTKLNSLAQYPPEKLFMVKDVPVPVRDGSRIKARVYKAEDSDNQPIIMYFHGGGFVIGDIESHDLNCRRLAKHTDCVVVSVDYRLAPEHPFPIPGEDCYDATVWAVENASFLGANPNQVAVMGDSAGGNLATVVAMMARDKGGPKISYQVLIYPTTDATLSKDSINKLAKGYILTKETMQWFVKKYCGHVEDLKQPYLSPLFADLKNMPPALLITGEYDPLKDEGEAYAKRLIEAGNKVVFKEYKGMIHVFYQMPKFLKAARELEAQIAFELNKAFKV